MSTTSDAYPAAAHARTAVNPAKLRDEINRLSQRLVRARESYNQDFLQGHPEVPLDEQMSVIESYSARLELATEELRRHEAGTVPAPVLPTQPSQSPAEPPAENRAEPPAEIRVEPPAENLAEPPAQIRAEPTPQPEPLQAQRPEPEVPQPAAPNRITGPGITNPDGTALAADGGAILRTEDAAVGEYVRHAADQRWLTATGRSAGDELDAVCERILAALAHKHGVALEDERQLLARQVDARYRRDYG